MASFFRIIAYIVRLGYELVINSILDWLYTSLLLWPDFYATVAVLLIFFPGHYIFWWLLLAVTCCLATVILPCAVLLVVANVMFAYQKATT